MCSVAECVSYVYVCVCVNVVARTQSYIVRYTILSECPPTQHSTAQHNSNTVYVWHTACYGFSVYVFESWHDTNRFSLLVLQINQMCACLHTYIPNVYVRRAHLCVIECMCASPFFVSFCLRFRYFHYILCHSTLYLKHVCHFVRIHTHIIYIQYTHI